jgi:hypothetical protein
MEKGIDMAMLSRAQGLMDKFTSMTPAPNVFRVATETQKDRNENAAFPVQLGSTDPEDQKWALRNKVMTAAGNPANGVLQGVGQVVADDSFFDYAKRKKDQEVLYDFYRFVMSNAKLDTPEAAQWWFGKFPWMRDMRLAEIDKQAELQKTLARIQITGPESEDDFMLLFLIRNGTIQLPNYPLHKMGVDRPVAKDFETGFFSPFSKPPWTKTPVPFGGQRSVATGGSGGYKVGFSQPLNIPYTDVDQLTGINPPGDWRALLGLQ